MTERGKNRMCFSKNRQENSIKRHKTKTVSLLCRRKYSTLIVSLKENEDHQNIVFRHVVSSRHRHAMLRLVYNFLPYNVICGLTPSHSNVKSTCWMSRVLCFGGTTWMQISTWNASFLSDCFVKMFFEHSELTSNVCTCDDYSPIACGNCLSFCTLSRPIDSVRRKRVQANAIHLF